MEQEGQHAIDSLIKRLLGLEKAPLFRQAENFSSNISMTSGSALLSWQSTRPGRQTRTTEIRGRNYKSRRGGRLGSHDLHSTHDMVAGGRGQSRPSWHQPYSTRPSNMGRVGAQVSQALVVTCSHPGNRWGSSRYAPLLVDSGV